MLRCRLTTARFRGSPSLGYLRLGTDDAEFFHPELERGSVQSQASRGTPWPGDHPPGVGQGRDDVTAFRLLQCLPFAVLPARRRARSEIAEWNVQNGSGGKNDSAFHQVLQLTNVSRPAVSRHASIVSDGIVLMSRFLRGA